MSLPVGLNRSRSAVVFVVNETTPGLINAQVDANDAFGLTTTPVMGQSGNYTDTSEIGAELISVDRVLNYMEYATYDFEYYAKPGGTDLSTIIDISDGAGTNATVTEAAGLVTFTPASGSIPANIEVGATIQINGVDLTIVDVNSGAGTFAVQWDAASAVSYVSGLGGAGVASVQLVRYNFAQNPEHDLLSRSFGGVKYMSRGEIYAGGNALQKGSGYYAGDGSGVGSYVPSKVNATAAQFFLKNTVQTFTVTSRQFTDKSIQMYTATGSLPTNFSVTFAKDGPVTFSSSFQSNRVFYGGTATIDTQSPINVTANGDTTLTITDPIRYGMGLTNKVESGDVAWYHADSSIGMACKLMDANGAVYPSSETEFFTVASTSGADVVINNPTATAYGPSGVFASGQDLYLIPFTPAPCPDTGGILDQRKVQVFLTDAPALSEDLIKTFDWEPSANTQLFHPDNALDVTSVNIDFDRSITTPGLTEMTGEEFPPASYIINEPTISGSMTLLLRPKDFQFMNSLRDEPRRSVGIRVGSVAGKIIEIGIAAAFLEIPTPSDADGATQIDIGFTAIRGVECDDADKFMVRYR